MSTHRQAFCVSSVKLYSCLWVSFLPKAEEAQEAEPEEEEEAEEDGGGEVEQTFRRAACRVASLEIKLVWSNMLKSRCKKLKQ